MFNLASNAIVLPKLHYTRNRKFARILSFDNVHLNRQDTKGHQMILYKSL